MTQTTQDSNLIEVEAWIAGLQRTERAGYYVGEAHGRYAGKHPTLYLDTTIPSYLTARPSRDINTDRMHAITRRWWSEDRPRHISYVSDLVIDEARKGDSDAAQRRVEVVRAFASLHRSARSYELADKILVQCRLPARVHSDVHHVAIAALHGINILLTWNCAHLANRHMIPHIRRACEAYGCAAPDIYTPEQLIGVCAYGRSDS